MTTTSASVQNAIAVSLPSLDFGRDSARRYESTSTAGRAPYPTPASVVNTMSRYQEEGRNMNTEDFGKSMGELELEPESEGERFFQGLLFAMPLAVGFWCLIALYFAL